MTIMSKRMCHVGMTSCDSSYYLHAGNQPLVIGRGGLSGLFPEGSQLAIQMGQSFSVPNMGFLCNLQMSKDGAGVCISDIKLDNATNIAAFDPEGQKTINFYGKQLTGWFTVSYNADVLYQNLTRES